MTAKQWLWVTGVVILNIIIFGALLGAPSLQQSSTPTPVWTVHPTFTPMPFPTATAILMPTDPVIPVSTEPLPTPQVHVVQEDETLESIAEMFGIGTYTLRMLNRLSEQDTIRVGQELIVPSTP
jgi:LysM repeat protein